MSNSTRDPVLAIMTSHVDLERQLIIAREIASKYEDRYFELRERVEEQARAIAGYVEQAAFAERVRMVNETGGSEAGRLRVDNQRWQEKVKSQARTIAIYRQAFTDHEVLCLKLRAIRYSTEPQE